MNNNNNNNNIVGKTVCFTYNGTKYERRIIDVIAQMWDTWTGDLGWDSDSDPATSFIIHGNTVGGVPVLNGLCVQFDNMSTSAHGYIRELTVKQ